MGSGRFAQPQHHPRHAREDAWILHLVGITVCDLEQQFLVLIDLRRAGGSINEADPQVPALNILVEQLGELGQGHRVVLHVAVDLGDLDAQVLVSLLFLSELVIDREGFLVIALPGQHVGQQSAGLAVLQGIGNLLGQIEACLLASRLVVLRLRCNEDVLLAFLAGEFHANEKASASLYRAIFG